MLAFFEKSKITRQLLTIDLKDGTSFSDMAYVKYFNEGSFPSSFAFVNTRAKMPDDCFGNFTTGTDGFIIISEDNIKLIVAHTSNRYDDALADYIKQMQVDIFKIRGE